jgi:protocatechuate 3,4-dioxygenase beta subunit
VDAALRPGGTITGVVTGQAGEPVPQICVGAYPANLSALFVTGYLGYGSETGRTGRFTVTGLAPGRYQVSAVPCNVRSKYAQEWFDEKAFPSAANLVLVRSGKTSDIRMPMTIGGTVSGRVISASGRLMRNVCVFAVGPAGYLIDGAFTGLHGRYQIADLMPGRYELQASQCAEDSPRFGAVIRLGTQVRAGRTTGNVTIKLTRAGAISGSVLKGTSATAAPGICVYAVPRRRGAQDGLAVTKADGAYQLAGLVPGSYQVYFTGYCAYAAGTDDVVPGRFSHGSGHLETVQVRAGHVTAGVSATLMADGAIAGTINTRSAVPVAGECVGAFARDRTTPAAIAISGYDGSYLISELPPGVYRVEFSLGCGARRYPVQWWHAVSSRSAATAVHVRAGQTIKGINARLRSR